MVQLEYSTYDLILVLCLYIHDPIPGLDWYDFVTLMFFFIKKW